MMYDVSVMTSSSLQVSKLYATVECLFLFQWYKNYKNRPRNARVVVKNNAASFFPDTVYQSIKHYNNCYAVTPTHAHNRAIVLHNIILMSASDAAKRQMS